MPFAGKTVDIQVQWTGGELANFQASVADFAKATGMTIQIDSVPSSHETVLKSRIEGGSPPDIAQLAQPTPVLAYAAEGKVIDLATFMDANKLTSEYPSTIGLLTDGSHIWGVPYKADVKSMIWYPIKAFQAKGYQVPTTWDQLIALSDQIVADGSNPWCISAGGPGDATGWQITDWVEEVVLKTQGLDYYNNWINHTVTFEDQGIKYAFAEGGPDLLHGQLRLRRSAGDHQYRPEDHHGPDVQPARHAGSAVLAAEDPDLVRAGLLPRSARQRAAVQVHRGHRRGHHPVPDRSTPATTMSRVLRTR